MKLRFRGVRGSYPVPGQNTLRYGGNTSCIEVRLDDGTLIILDAGSGIRNLGNDLMEDEAFAGGGGEATVLITHTHWDHIMGMPYFRPADVKGNRFDLYARKSEFDLISLEEVFKGQQAKAYADRRFTDFAADFTYNEILEGDMLGVGGATITTTKLNHPCYALGYRIAADDASLVYITDTSPYTDILLGTEFVKNPNDAIPGPNSPLRTEMMKRHDAMLKLIAGADLVIYDTFFEPENYKDKPHWGHSTPVHAIENCVEAGAKRLALFHHAPNASDSEMDGIQEKYRNQGKEAGLDVFASAEGLEVSIGA